MASDSTDAPRRKHHRSASDDDTEEPSKRRKHRHNHHPRSSKHRHHHRSKKDENKQIEGEIENKHEEIHDKISDGEAAVAEPAVNVGTAALVAGMNLGIDYEMEEGEIIEENNEGFAEAEGGGCGVVGAGEIANSDRIINDLSTVVHEIGVESKNLTKSSENDAKRKENKMDGSEIHDEVHLGKKSRAEHLVNDESVENGLPFGESGRRRSHYDDKSDFDGKTQSLSSKNAGKRDEAVKHTPCLEHSRSCCKSPYRSRERSRSRSVLRESSLLGTPSKQDDEYYAEMKRRSDSIDDRISVDSKDHRHGSRDLLRGKERELSSSLHTGRGDRHHSRETRERDRAGSREIERERIRGRERERERERKREIDKERERDGERRQQRDRGSSRDRSRDRDSNRSSRPRKHDDDRDRHGEPRDKRHDETGYRERMTIGNREKVWSPKHSPPENNKTLKRDEDEQEDYEERIGLQLAEQEEEDLDRIKEESRRRRQAILEKYKSQQSQQQTQANGEDRVKDQAEQPSQPATAANVVSEVPDGRTEGVDVYVAEPSFAIGKSPPQNGPTVLEKASGTAGLGEGTPKSERSTDMFCDDIFGESPAAVRKPGKGDGFAIEKSGLHDNWDDAEGYYSYRFGELLDGRYEIVAAHGKGVFSTVVRAKDLKAKPGDPEEVAIKMIRNNETMYKAGMTELVILKKLVGADPEDRRHCVRFISSFKYRNHLCLVFESLHMNLREVLKRFGRNIGLKLTAVRAYAKQLFIALKHLKNCGVLHCDIKPDNMLVNEAKNVLKLCDFGNAMFAGKNEITPYLVSRFYRAPEIILGLPYDHPMDMWSVGCCLFELYAGKVLFPGPSNNDMLRLHMELKGPFPKKMLRKGAFTDQHFDQDLNFLATEEDPVTKRAIKRLILNIKPKDIGVLISGSSGEDLKMLANFKDLLDKIFVLDPDKRLTVSQALSHTFITVLWKWCSSCLKSTEMMFSWETPLTWRITTNAMRQPSSALGALKALWRRNEHPGDEWEPASE